MGAQRQVLFWLAAALFALVAVLTLRSVLLPFVVGVVVAYALNPIADRLERAGLGRIAACALIVACLVVLVLLAFLFIVPLLANQLQQLAVSAPGELDRLKTLVETWARANLGTRYPDFQAGLDRAAAHLSSNWADVATAVARSVWAQGLAIVNFVSLLLITPLVVFYFLADWHPMMAKIDGWLPRDHQVTIRRLAISINDAISAFIRGQGLVCIVLGLFYAAGLAWVGLRYGLLIGLATGLLAFIPFVGWALGLIVAGGMTLVEFWPETLPLLKVGAIFAAGMTLDSAWLSPKIVGSKIGLHPVWLIFALFVFSYLFGLVGMLVAVPVAAAAAVLVRFALEVYLSSSIYRGSAGAAADNDRKD